MRITYTGVGLFWIWLFVNAFTLSAQEKLELSTSYPQKVDNFTLTITFHIDGKYKRRSLTKNGSKK